MTIAAVAFWSTDNVFPCFAREMCIGTVNIEVTEKFHCRCPIYDQYDDNGDLKTFNILRDAVHA